MSASDRRASSSSTRVRRAPPGGDERDCSVRGTDTAIARASANTSAFFGMEDDAMVRAGPRRRRTKNETKSSSAPSSSIGDDRGARWRTATSRWFPWRSGCRRRARSTLTYDTVAYDRSHRRNRAGRRSSSKPLKSTATWWRSLGARPRRGGDAAATASHPTVVHLPRAKRRTRR